MSHVVNGILMVVFDDKTLISKIDDLIEQTGFSLDMIQTNEVNEAQVDYYIDESVSVATNVYSILEDIEKLQGVKGAMWVQNKNLTESYDFVFTNNLTDEDKNTMATQFFDKQKKLIDNALNALDRP